MMGWGPTLLKFYFFPFSPGPPAGADAQVFKVNRYNRCIDFHAPTRLWK
jgi:hypothetical protein